MSHLDEKSAGAKTETLNIAVDPRPPREGEGNAAQLIVVEGPQPGQVYELQSNLTTIGRQEGCDVVLDSITVSRNHASIALQGGHYYVIDVGSSNGVYLNGQRIPQGQNCLLRHGDVLRLGEFVLLFKQRERLANDPGMSSIHLDSTKVRKEVDEFLKDVLGGDEGRKRKE